MFSIRIKPLKQLHMFTLRKLILFSGLAAVCLVASSFRHSAQNKYSIDALPESWKTNKSLISAIDLIIPTTVGELENSAACTGCDVDYSLSLLLDSAIVLKQTVRNISDKRNNEGFSYECTTVYHFKSSLAVYDRNNKGIAKVMVTDPITDEYVSKKKFNIPRVKGKAVAETPEQFIAAHPRETGPAQEDLLNNAEKKIYKLRDQVSKMLKRRI